jgi:hypothetical protein
VESIAGPICHVSSELVTFDNDVRIEFGVVAVPKVGVFNVNHSSSRANVLSKQIVDENDWPLVSSDDERCHSFDLGDYLRVIKCLIWIYALLK